MGRTTIYTIMTFNKLEKSKTGFPDFGAENLVGFTMDKETAFDWVKNNACDIWEHAYGYALIEEVQEGLYEPAGKDHRWLFQYDIETGTYKEIDEPDFLEHFCGFSIG